MKQRKNRKGFTLVELLVVIAILAILATVSVVGYTSFLNKARQSNCETEAHQVEQAINAAIMVPNGEYEIGSDTSEVSGSSSNWTYTVTEYTVKTCTDNSDEYIAIVKVVTTYINSSSDSTAPTTAADGWSATAAESLATTSDDINAAFKNSADFGELDGKFTIVKNSKADGVVLEYAYSEYEGVSATITVE